MSRSLFWPACWPGNSSWPGEGWRSPSGARWGMRKSRAWTRSPRPRPPSWRWYQRCDMRPPNWTGWPRVALTMALCMGLP